MNTTALMTSLIEMVAPLGPATFRADGGHSFSSSYWLLKRLGLAK